MLIVENNCIRTFLNLVRIGIGHQARIYVSKTDWNRVKSLADKQGLTAVVLDALNTKASKLAEAIPVQLKLEWIGEVLKNYEQRYVQYEKAIGLMAGFYNQHEFKMMVLKGYACSLDWPKPEHRPCGDIDIWQFGEQKAADAVLLNLNDNHNDNLGSPDGSKSQKNLSQNQIKIDTSHHHHTVFEWQGFTVENHYDFVNVHHHRSSAKIEGILKELGKDDSHYVELMGEKVYLPSPNLHALFLLRHAISHFASSELNLRQVLDWGFFMVKHGKDVDWEWFYRIIDKYQMRRFFNCLNTICIDDLGFDSARFPALQSDLEVKERVLEDILSPMFMGEEPNNLITRVVFKYRRWIANEWKHKLCYKESMWSAFWSGVWNHLLKPSSI